MYSKLVLHVSYNAGLSPAMVSLDVDTALWAPGTLVNATTQKAPGTLGAAGVLSAPDAQGTTGHCNY